IKVVHVDGKRYHKCFCGKFLSSRSALDRHTRTHTGEKPYCKVCGKWVQSRSHLLVHMRTHTGEKPYSCSVCSYRTAQSDSRHNPCSTCGKVFSSQFLLQVHVRVHTGEKPFKCEVCTYRSTQKGHVMRHMVSQHPEVFTSENLHGVKVNRCPICGKLFPSRAHVKLHMRVHTGEKPFVCQICGKDTNSMPEEWCSVCGKVFTSKQSLKVHQRIHTGEKPYSCHICGKMFNVKSNMKRHMVVHYINPGEEETEKEAKRWLNNINSPVRSLQQNISETMYLKGSFENSQWGKTIQTFSKSGNRNAHLKIHSGEKPHECRVCGKRFYTSNNSMVDTKTEEGQDTSMNGSNNKRYQCSFCYRLFSRAGNLNTHMRIHTGEKPYECSVCGKRFNRSLMYNSRPRGQELPVYEQSNKRYQCSYCQRTFSQSGNLTTHMRIHTGEKPFECSVCLKRFRRSNNMKTHMLGHIDLKASCANGVASFLHGNPVWKSIIECTLVKNRIPVKYARNSLVPRATGEDIWFVNQLVQSGSSIHCRGMEEMAPSTHAKPYTCRYCQKSFAKSGNLTSHERIHTGEKPYQCQVCQKRFNQRSNMRSHMAVHYITK
ncbi:ZFP26-like protein, partial [Mya arenaria]